MSAREGKPGKAGCDLRLTRFISLGMFLLAGMAEICHAEDYAFTVYGGPMTKETWVEALSLNAELTDAWILVGALTRTVNRFGEGALSLEVEGQVAGYFGDQTNLEFNLPVAVRWGRFPWDRFVDTSLAAGLGPSWATEDPAVEKRGSRTTRQFLVYWFIEASAGPPGANWSGVFRLHHRSTGFGLLAEDGGSNTLAAGLKIRF